MKVIRVLMMILCVFFIFTSMIFANAGPTYWLAYPSWEGIAIEENTPIEVTKEELTFDFSREDYLDYSLSGDIKARYYMKNPTNKDISIQMAFPFVGSLLSGQDEIQVKLDQESIPYEIYLGESISNQKTLPSEHHENIHDIKEILSFVSREPYEAKNFKEKEVGKLYSIEVNLPMDQEINLSMSFSYEDEKTKIISDGFNSLEWDDGWARIGSWCRGTTTLEIYVLGEDIHLDIETYKDGQLKEKINFNDFEIKTQEIEFRTYMFDYIYKAIDLEFKDSISKDQLYNFYAREWDTVFSKNNGLATAEDLLTDNYDIIFVLVYDVDFLKNNEREIQVSYQTTATMDRTQTKDPLYSVDYILNPAQYWNDFKNLSIQIIPSPEQPYLVSSNMDFKKEGKIYTASFTELPKGDLTFTLYNKENISFMDKIMGSLGYRYGYYLPVIIVFASLLAFIFILILIIMWLRKKYNKIN